MKIDFSQCKIIEPRGKRLDSFYKKMWDIFPYDRPIYEILMEKGNSNYPMKTYALYNGESLLGNAGIFPFKIWQNGAYVDIFGIGAVATMPEYRRQGVASRLLKHCLSLIDNYNAVSILFTELSAVYEPLGFETVNQDYRAVAADKETFSDMCCDFRVIDLLNEKDIKIVDRLYSIECPLFNGKVVREKAYWEYYRMMFDPYQKPEIVFCRTGGEDAGYVRYEFESDRLTITEFCCRQDRENVISALLFFMNRKSIQAGFPMITIALSKDHFIWNYLQKKNIRSVKEVDGVRREIFMIRPTAEEKARVRASLFWSLADKF